VAAENELQDLHDEIVDVAGVLCARCDALDGEINPALKDKIAQYMRKAHENLLGVLSCIDEELIKLKSGEEPPPL